MAIGRTTKRNSKIWNEQFTARRAQDAQEEVMGYEVRWELSQPSQSSSNTGQLIASLDKATANYERHKRVAVFVELLQYDDSVHVLRRFCNVRRYKDKYGVSPDLIYAAGNPPYELEE